MWKRRLGAAAWASVLLLGVAAPSAVARRETAPPGAASRVAAATAVARDDERGMLLTGAASVAGAMHRLDQQRAAAEAARVAAERAAAEAARVAAEQAAAEVARVAAGEVARVAAQRVALAARPPTTGAAATAPSGPRVAWTTRVVNSGGQDAVDRCLGGLTHWFEDVDGKPYYPIHGDCGGAPILSLHRGDLVRIDGALWTVTDSRDVATGSHYSAAAGMNGRILLQTCHHDDTTMRLVALTPA